MKTLLLRFPALTMVAAAVVGMAGCGDVVANQGNLGNLVYALFTTYNLEESDLSEASLITGVQHRIVVTEAPGADVGDKSAIVHRLFPDDDTTVTTDTPQDDSFVGDALIRVDQPGEYTLQSWNGTELVDYIGLKFVDAAELEVLTYLRTPSDTEFARAQGEVITLPLWSQATFMALPVDAQGNRLVGDIGLDLTIDPADSMIQVYNLVSVFEDEIWESAIPMNMVFVKTGSTEVTLTEPLTGLFKTITFVVTEEAVPAE